MTYSRENIGVIIKVLRKERLKIDQSTLAKTLGVTQGTISKIENGTLEPGGAFLLDFFKTYKVPHAEFTKFLDFYIKETLRLQKSNHPNMRKELIANLTRKISKAG